MKKKQNTYACVNLNRYLPGQKKNDYFTKDGWWRGGKFVNNKKPI